MFPHQKLIKRAGAAILIISLTTIGCHVNDRNDVVNQANKASADTSNISMESLMNPDTATVALAVDNAAINTGETAVAKPNPAKKGLKGKVMITAAPKPTGAMEADNSGVYSNVEYIPTYPGGNKGLQTYFNKNIEYPQDASDEGIDGTVMVSFVVDENGKLTAPVVAGQKLGYGLEEEAIRVISKMPNWTPGKLNGKNVKSKYTLPVRFELY